MLVARCDGSGPWAAQLRRQGTATYHQLANDLAALKKKLGITRKLTPHDLRRTTARKLYALTGDLRDVQSLLGHSELQTTLWYLQDALQVVSTKHLELAKLNPTTEAIQ
jgi:site-specific recombinase XerC